MSPEQLAGRSGAVSQENWQPGYCYDAVITEMIAEIVLS